jgi:endoglucanase
MYFGEDLFSALRALLEAPGVSGNEGQVAQTLRGLLVQAGFAADDIHRDGIGNHWITAGPPGDAQRLLVAHMDEIGLRISSVRDDGLCRVVAVGGIDAQLWEGTLVHVHTQNGVVPGCIVPLSLHVTTRQGLAPSKRLDVSELLLDVGVRSAAELTALGVRMLDSVTWPKVVTRLAGSLVQARSLDDRFGCSALLATAAALHREQPAVPTVLAWAVQEEVGLRGARVLARTFSRCTEVIAVDSYTIAGPRDNTQFAGPRLGGGPVLRSLDATTVMPDAVRDAVLAKAKALGTELQFGYMPGGNDASVFEDSGARVFTLSVCLQNSHTAVERIHLGDLESLSKLCIDWCQSGIAL